MQTPFEASLRQRHLRDRQAHNKRPEPPSPPPQPKTPPNLHPDTPPSLRQVQLTPLESYEYEHLLKERAKHFVAKLKREKERNEGRLVALKQEEERRKQAELMQREQERRQELEVQRERKRSEALETLREVEYKRSIRQKTQPSPLAKPGKSIHGSRVVGVEVTLSPSSKHFPSIAHSQPTPTKSKAVPPSKRSLSQIEDRLENYLYLSIEDERRIDSIKQKLERLAQWGEGRERASREGD